MRWWWVNHGQTRDQEVHGHYLWSPKKDKNGARNQTYDNMLNVQPGDVIFSYADVKIGAVGIATKRAVELPKPKEFGVTGSNWAKKGWFLPVSFVELWNEIHPKSQIEIIRDLLPEKYSPIRRNGNGNQKFYLMEISRELGIVLLQLTGIDGEDVLSDLGISLEIQTETDFTENEIINDKEISSTEKKQLVFSRRGQGVFKTRVSRIESHCRITGIKDIRHLRASHIKPWRLATNKERLDGQNGFLFAPHVDHLFDEGYISFGDDGKILISPRLSFRILSAWGINSDANAGAFTSQQMIYLDFHRREILKK